MLLTNRWKTNIKQKQIISETKREKEKKQNKTKQNKTKQKSKEINKIKP